jgi:hypothetical protein
MSVQPGAEQKTVDNKQTPPPGEVDPNKAKGAGAADGAGDDQDLDFDEAQIPENMKGYVQKLRKEAGKYRTKAKNLEGELAGKNEHETKLKKALAILGGKEEGEEVDPEVAIPQLQTRLQGMEVEHAILQSAYQSGVPHDSLSYYRFLLSERLEALGDGEELGDDDMAEIVAEVQKVKAAKSAEAAPGGTGAKGAAPQPAGNGGTTVEQFAQMSVSEKSALYAKDPNLYNSLRGQLGKLKK